MSKRAEEAALKAYPEEMIYGESTLDGKYDGNKTSRYYFIKGYEQAEKDLTPAFEFPFEVPDNDGHIVFTPMDNMTIRKELKLKKGERVIVSIRKEHEKE